MPAADSSSGGRSRPEASEAPRGRPATDHLGHPKAAAEIVDAIAAVLATTDIHTGDLGGSATTTEFSDAVIHSLERVPTNGTSPAKCRLLNNVAASFG